IEQAKVYANDDGTMSVNDLKDPNGVPTRFREIGPMLFRNVNDQDKVGFKRNDAGNFVMAIDFPFMVFQHTAWYHNGAFNTVLIVSALVILVLALILWPVMPILRRHYGTRLQLDPGQKRLRLLVRLTCLFFVIFFVAYALFFTVALKDIGLLSPRGNIWIRLIQLTGWF